MMGNENDAFTNAPVDPDRIPGYSSVEFRGVASGYRSYTLISTLVGFLPPALAGIVLALVSTLPFTGGWGVVLGAVVMLAVLIALNRWVDAGYRGWAVREHDVIARSGVVWRSVVGLPVARIQHVETTHGPLERRFGLARMKLYTAGGMTADLTVLGLERDRADDLREYLVEQIRRRDAEARDHGRYG